MSANIDEAIEDIADDIGSLFASVVTRYGTWITEMFTEAGFNPPGTFWDPENEEERSVFDWVVPGLLTQREINNTGNGQLSANLAINTVLRTLLAVKFATIAGRITANQETSVVTAYTNAWA